MCASQQAAGAELPLMPYHNSTNTHTPQHKRSFTRITAGCRLPRRPCRLLSRRQCRRTRLPRGLRHDPVCGPCIGPRRRWTPIGYPSRPPARSPVAAGAQLRCRRPACLPGGRRIAAGAPQRRRWACHGDGVGPAGPRRLEHGLGSARPLRHGAHHKVVERHARRLRRCCGLLP